MKIINRWNILIVVAAAFLIGGIFWLTGEKNPSANTNGRIKIAAAENFWGDIAKQIAGDKAEVTSILNDPYADPHLYDANARDAAAVSNAQIVVYNGLGYDDFMDKLFKASPGQRRTVKVASVLGVKGNDDNPHLWYDLIRIGQVAKEIEQKLVMQDPGDKAIFESNLKHFNDSLKPLLAKINEIHTKYTNAPVAYTERVPRYLLDSAGLDVKTPEDFADSIESGQEPSVAARTEMEELIKNHQIRVLIYNSQTTSPVTENVRDLAQRSGVPVVDMSETMPLNQASYQSWQASQLDSLLAALENKH